jgi:F-type H+-transporting ATPase subunit delta
MTLLAKRYAGALFALAAEKGAVDAIDADVAWLGEALADATTRSLLTSPDVTDVERQAVLDKLIAGRDQLVQNLVGVLRQRRRLEVLEALPPAFRRLVMESRGEVEGTAESAHPLAADELRSLTELAGRLSGKKVLLTASHRPELIGGVRLVVGNVLYDGSLRAALQQLETQLQQTTV